MPAPRRDIPRKRRKAPAPKAPTGRRAPQEAPPGYVPPRGPRPRVDSRRPAVLPFRPRVDSRRATARGPGHPDYVTPRGPRRRVSPARDVRGFSPARADVIRERRRTQKMFEPRPTGAPRRPNRPTTQRRRTR